MSTADPPDDAPWLEAAMQRHRRELHVYCYRLLGSFDDAEDHVQEVFLRAWRAHDTFTAHATVRTWLYRIATNACLDTLRRRRPRPLPDPVSSASPSVATVPGLQPYPERLLEELRSEHPGPEALAIARESLTLAYVAVVQLLPPRQRAVLILRDVLEFSARDVAALLDASVPAVKSALQRARATVRRLHGTDPSAWPGIEAEQQRLVEGFVAAHENADPDALIALLTDDVRLAIAPEVGEWNGRDEVSAALREGMNSLGAWRVLVTAANGRPAAVGYVRRPGEQEFVPFVISVLEIRDGRLAEIAAFEDPSLVAAFGLPAVL